MNSLKLAILSCVIYTFTLTYPIWASKETNTVPEYCWRNYNGILPEDAVQGGKDKAENPTYVGQAYFKEYGLLPAIIFEGSLFANATAHVYEITTNKNIKILCTKHKEFMQWVPVENAENHLLTSHHFIDGGSEIGHTIFIGRVQHDGQLVTGKVFLAPVPNSGLWIPYNNVPIRFTSYEILTYNQTLATAIDFLWNSMELDVLFV